MTISSVATALIAALVLAVIGVRAAPAPAPGTPVAQFCLPQDVAAEAHRLFCRSIEG